MKPVSFYFFCPTFSFVLVKLSGHSPSEFICESPETLFAPLLLPEFHLGKTLSPHLRSRYSRVFKSVRSLVLSGSRVANGGGGKSEENGE